jgi:asparagine synthase (glutamine-hydrolysing)
MCGITGIFAFNLAGKLHQINLARSTDLLRHRGPDGRGTCLDDHVALGHRRLSILDLSERGAQPMHDDSGRYTLVYNGEIYNYRSLRQELEQKGHRFHSDGDTEVLLHALMEEGERCLPKLNGFFAFAFYDRNAQTLLLGRDRFGIKPLYYYFDEDKFLFASEMPALLAYGLEKKLDHTSLALYLQLNYVPAPHTMLEEVYSLMPGHWLRVSNRQLNLEPYYSIPYDPGSLNPENLTYEQQQERLRGLLHQSVRDRLVSDVPLGTFLSGGIDSTIVSGIARQYVDELHTFSIGYSDAPYFDETRYAGLAARKFGTRHTVFSLSMEDLGAHLADILEAIDQPFADSSAIPTYILSQRTSGQVKVALSGDGADELFAGYNKHQAALRAMHPEWAHRLAAGLHPLWSVLPRSRHNALTNRFRQLHRFSEGMRLTQAERYWRWASFADLQETLDLLSEEACRRLTDRQHHARKEHLLRHIRSDADFNELLLTDMHLVLPDDMLKKVDMMSMAHGLEVRVPFLDHRLVEFVFRLPVGSKINGTMRKRILQDAFRDLMPPEIYRRPKKGFEVPLLRWLRGPLRSRIEDDLLSERRIAEQQLFRPEAVRRLKKQLFSISPGDVHARIWALVVFQWWWKKYME